MFVQKLEEREIRNLRICGATLFVQNHMVVILAQSNECFMTTPVSHDTSMADIQSTIQEYDSQIP